jgi:SNF2 family DNA or RNA helicase
MRELEPLLPSTFQAELRDYQAEGYLRMITTGTPIENHLGELWNLFRFINPGLLGSLEGFNRRFATSIEQHRDQGARHRLRQLLRPFILRRLKSDVLTELPPRTEITLRLELRAGEMALYEAMRQQGIERLEETAEANQGKARIQLLAEIMRLRRACCHPRLALPDSDLASAKLEALSQFVGHLALIRAHLDARGIRYQYLDGATPEAQRRAAVAAFQAGEGELFLKGHHRGAHPQAPRRQVRPGRRPARGDRRRWAPELRGYARPGARAWMIPEEAAGDA